MCCKYDGEIRAELISIVDQWMIDKSADLVDRLIEQLSKKEEEADDAVS